MSTTTATTSSSQDIAKDCLICLHLLIEPVTFPCNHTVCKSCYDLILEKSNVTCPFCRKRLSTWCRKHARFDLLVNQEKWREIREMFPEQVRLAEEGKWEEIESSDAGQKMIDRIISAPGEVKEEFEKFIQQEEEIRKREKLEQEEASLDFIRKQFPEELEFYETQMKQIQEDEALAKQLNEESTSSSTSSSRRPRHVFVPDEEDDERGSRVKRVRSYREFFDDD